MQMKEWLSLATFVALIYAALHTSGCAVTRSYTSDTPGGTTTSSYESYAGGLVVRSDEVTHSRGAYADCLEARRRQSGESGHIVTVDDQASCYRQTVSPGDPRGSMPVVTVPVYPYGYGGYGSSSYMGYFPTTGAPVRY